MSDSTRTIVRQTVLLGSLLGASVFASQALACTVVRTPGPTINAAAIQPNLTAAGVTLDITGVCNEAVTITHDDVTLRGSGDIKAPSPGLGNNGITIIGAKRVLIEGLTVSRGDNGILMTDGASADIRAVLVKLTLSVGINVFDGSTAFIAGQGSVPARVNNNKGYGINVSRNAHAVIEDTVVNGNDFDGMFIGKGGYAELQARNGVAAKNVRVTNNGGSGLGVGTSGAATLEQATVTGNGMYGLDVYYNSSVRLDRTTVMNNGRTELSVFADSSAEVRDSVIEHHFDVTGTVADTIGVTNQSNLTLRDTTVVNNNNTTLASQTGFGCAIVGVDNANLDINAGNTISSNAAHANVGAALCAYRHVGITVRNGDTAGPPDNFNRILNTAGNQPLNNSSCYSEAWGGTAIDVEQHSTLRVDSGHTLVQGNVYGWGYTNLDFRDVAISSGDVCNDGLFSTIRFRDQGTVVGNATMTGGTFFTGGNPTTIRTGSQSPTFDGANIDCNGSFPPASPTFINGGMFVNCP